MLISTSIKSTRFLNNNLNNTFNIKSIFFLFNEFIVGMTIAALCVSVGNVQLFVNMLILLVNGHFFTDLKIAKKV